MLHPLVVVALLYKFTFVLFVYPLQICKGQQFYTKKNTATILSVVYRPFSNQWNGFLAGHLIYWFRENGARKSLFWVEPKVKSKWQEMWLYVRILIYIALHIGIVKGCAQVWPLKSPQNSLGFVCIAIMRICKEGIQYSLVTAALTQQFCLRYMYNEKF